MRFWLHMHAEYHGQQVTTSYHHWPFLFKLPHHEPYGEEVKFVVKAMMSKVYACSARMFAQRRILQD